MKIWFGIADGQISSFFDRVSARDMSIFSFLDNSFSKISTDFHQTWYMCVHCIDIMEICFKIANGEIVHF